MEELKSIMEKFVASGWDLISVPAQQWLDGKCDKDALVSAIKQADKDILKANVTMRSRMRERRTYGSVRGLRREPLVYSTCEELKTSMNLNLEGNYVRKNAE